MTKKLKSTPEASSQVTSTYDALAQFRNQAAANIGLLIQQGTIKLYARGDEIYADPNFESFLVKDSPTACAIRVVAEIEKYLNDVRQNERTGTLNVDLPQGPRRRKPVSQATRAKISEGLKAAWAAKGRPA